MKNKTLRNIIVLSIAVSIVLFFSLKDNYTEIIQSLRDIKKTYLLVGIILMMLVTFIRGMVIHYLSKIYNKKTKIISSTKLAYETNFFNGITPFSTGGQPYQVLKLKNEGFKLADATNIVVQSSITYQIAALLLGIFAVTYNHFSNILESNYIMTRFVVVGFTLTLLFVLIILGISLSNKIKTKFLKFMVKLLGKLKIVKNKEETITKVYKYVEEFDEGVDLLFNNKKIFMLSIILQVLSLMIYYSIPTVIFLGLGINLGIIKGIAIFSYVMMAGAFIPLPGSTGGMEFSFIRFFSNFASGGILHAVMLLWRTITYYLNIVIGAIILGIKKK